MGAIFEGYAQGRARRAMADEQRDVASAGAGGQKHAALLFCARAKLDELRSDDRRTGCAPEPGERTMLRPERVQQPRGIFLLEAVGCRQRRRGLGREPIRVIPRRDLSEATDGRDQLARGGGAWANPDLERELGRQRDRVQRRTCREQPINKRAAEGARSHVDTAAAALRGAVRGKRAFEDALLQRSFVGLGRGRVLEREQAGSQNGGARAEAELAPV